MKLSLVLLVSLIGVTSVFGGECIVGETTFYTKSKVSMPKELHGLYYNSNSKESSKEDMCNKQDQGYENIIDCGIASEGVDCVPKKIISSKNHEYKITMNCSYVDADQIITLTYKKINEDIVVTKKGSKSYTLKPCK